MIMASESGINRVVRDVADLFELQMQLLSLDGRIAGEKAIRAAVMASVGLAILGSALTTLLIALGYLLHEGLEWSVGLSLLAVAIVATLVAGVFALVAYFAAKRAFAALGETTSEFSQNLKWIKGVIVKPESASRHPNRAESYPDDSARTYARAGQRVGPGY